MCQSKAPRGARAGGSLAEVGKLFLKRTSLHGLGHIFLSGSYLRRLTWLLAFVLSLTFLFSWCSNRVQYFLSSPVYTKAHVLHAQRLVFPVVTVCNVNLLLPRRMKRSEVFVAGQWLGLIGKNWQVSPGAREELKSNVNETPWSPLSGMADFGRFLPPPGGSQPSTGQLLDRIGHQMEEMLLSCRFQGQKCGHQNFSTIFTRYGKCYSFNTGQEGRPLLVTTKGGMGNGLELMLDIQQDEYLPVWGETDETSFEAGIKVQIHSQEEPPFIDQLGFGVAPGFQTFVSCQEQRLVYLPPPWGDCKVTPMDSEFFDTYSITACRIDCETRYLVENCNCRMVHMPGDAPHCTPEQYKECADPALDFLVEKDSDFCVCETPCNVTRYGKELSFVKIPSKASAKYLAKKFNKTEQYIADNILVLDIFFEALNYETIEQKKAYEVAGLLGDIGGQMGLFIGASILTILELFDYLYEVIKYQLCRCSQKKHKNTNNNEQGAVLNLEPVQRHTPCENLHPPSLFPANMLPHQPVQGNFEDFTC
ncbi:acid-sensing ion channel 1-like isoform X1 [Conger conger]|uniref:acid-sensing ion channel 1-like isoform X1 n=1 Tax=Conger conger TaxID=82655 RepID=UPI002A59D1C7|nr:acid-sensing ion channel 1-like isoform X1 [Conger conger]